MELWKAIFSVTLFVGWTKMGVTLAGVDINVLIVLELVGLIMDQ